MAINYKLLILKYLAIVMCNTLHLNVMQQLFTLIKHLEAGEKQ